MDCGSKDLFCITMSLLAEHGGEAVHALKWLPWVQSVFIEHIQAIIGLVGVSFGIWKWWYYREKVLHKRLQEYLAFEERRLDHARNDIITALYKPGEKREFAQPIFAVRPLRRVLHKRHWQGLFSIGKLETSADRQLDKALRRISSRLQAAEGQLRALHAQQASAFLLKGAIANSRAQWTTDRALGNALDYRALDQFRAALQVPGFGNDFESREFEARQLIRIGLLSDAARAYAELEPIANEVKDPRTRDLALSRIKKWQALLAQAEKRDQGSMIAYTLLTSAGGALRRREPYSPFERWDAIDQGDLHYCVAFVCRRLGYTNAEKRQLDEAATAYRRVQDSVPRSILVRSSNRSLRGVAEAGLRRVQSLRASGSYDETWLLPPSDKPKQETAAVSNSAGEQSIGQTAEERDIGEVGAAEITNPDVEIMKSQK